MRRRWAPEYCWSSMKLAFIIDPLESLKIHKDSSVAMMREALVRGHDIFVMQQGGLSYENKVVMAQVHKLRLIEPEVDSSRWYDESSKAKVPLEYFEVVMMRKDPPFDMEYIYSTYLLEMAQQTGVRVINHPRSVRDHNEKLAITKFPDFIPATLVTRNEHLIREFLNQHQDIVLKPLDGMGGASIFRVHSTDHNLSVILEMMTHYGTRTIMAQRFIPEIVLGDKRILLIAGKPVPYALARKPKVGEIRGNLAAGGTGVAQPLTERDLAIANTLGPILNNLGLMLVGLDVIGDSLTEINVTSPTGMQEITKQTGFNVAGMMIDALEALD